MIMADVLRIFLLIVGALTIFLSYWLISEALFPSLVTRSLTQYRKRPVKITLLGFLVGGPLTGAGLSLSDSASGDAFASILGLAFLSIPLLLGLAGSAGLCRLVGAGLPSPADETRPWHRVLRGGLIVAFTFLLPFLGWFVVMPWTIASGFGAALFSLHEIRKEQRKSNAPVHSGSMGATAA